MSSLPAVRSTSTGLALNEGPSVLGERQVRIPTAGKVRPGIKVLTKAAAQNKEAVRIYQQGVAAQKSFGVIEADIQKATNIKTPLVPKNVPYFTVRRSDFVVPEIADRINELYAEDGPEGRHIYRLPIIFPVDYWQAVLPHALQVFTRTERVYWSEYGPDGNRYCMTHKPLEVDPKARRAARPYGGRGKMLRPENEGRCVPEKCAEYQSGTCKLSGSLIFYIRGVPGGSACELPLTSFYGMQGIRQQMELVLHTRGRLSGVTFYLSKRQEEVSMLDLEAGKPKKVKQWIVVLEADIDMAKLLTRQDVIGAGAEAVAALEGPSGVIESEADHAENDEASLVAAEANPGLSIQELQQIVVERVHGHGIEFKHFNPYAANKWGANWTNDEAVLSRIVEELDSVEDSDAYRARVIRNDDDCPF